MADVSVLQDSQGNEYDIKDATARASIPTATSQLTNDSDFVEDASYVHTDNNYTTTEKNKLAGIASGAEVNVQADWDVTSSSSDAYIKNKPSIPTKTSDLTNDSNFVEDAGYVHTDNNYTTAEKSKLAGIASGAEVNVQADWDVTSSSSDAYIKNKPTIPSKTSELTNDSGYLSGVKFLSGTTTASSVTFSTAFSTTPRVVVSIYNTTISTPTIVAVNARSTTGFSVWRQYYSPSSESWVDSNARYEWIAIGT